MGMCLQYNYVNCIGRPYRIDKTDIKIVLRRMNDGEDSGPTTDRAPQHIASYYHPALRSEREREREIDSPVLRERHFMI